MKEESLRLCDFYDMVIVRLLLAHLILVESAQTFKGVPHTNGVAENQAVVVHSEVFCTCSHFLILFCHSFKEAKTSSLSLLDWWQGGRHNQMGTLTLPLHLNHPQFIFLRAQLAGWLQLGMFLNDMHDFLDEVSKRVLKTYVPPPEKQINILVNRGNTARMWQLNTFIRSSIIRTVFFCSFLKSSTLLVMSLVASKLAQI